MYKAIAALLAIFCAFAPDRLQATNCKDNARLTVTGTIDTIIGPPYSILITSPKPCDFELLMLPKNVTQLPPRCVQGARITASGVIGNAGIGITLETKAVECQ